MIHLKSYQEPGFEAMKRALSRHDGTTLAGPTGYGKTYVAAALARAAGVPVAVLCPKAVVGSWEQVLLDAGCTVLFVRNYESLFVTKTRSRKDPNLESVGRGGKSRWQDRSDGFEYGRWVVRQRTWKWQLPNQVLLIFDETQRCRSRKSQASKFLVAAARQGISTVLSTATLAENPMQMYSIGMALGLHQGVDFDGWCQLNGCKKGPWGLEYDETSGGMDKLRQRLYPEYGYTCRIQDLDGFPKNHVSAVSVDVRSKRQVNLIWKQLQALEEARREDDERARERAERGEDAGGHDLTKQLRLRQEVELYKVSALAEKAKEAVDAGNSVFLAVNFRGTLEALQKQFEGEHVSIHGGQNERERQTAIGLFQNNKIHVCLSMIAAGGTGISLHDLHGRPRVALICPGWSATELIQVLGRICRSEGKSPAVQQIITAEGTVESRVKDAINKKITCMETLHDQDLLTW